MRGTRELPLDEFFLDYRKTALAPDEVIQSLSMPRLWEGEIFHCDKVSKRRDQDISTVAGAYRLRIKQRQDRGCAAGLRRHGGDAARGRERPRRPC